MIRFRINHSLLDHARAVLSQRKRLYWLIGGAGAGKTLICDILSKELGLPVYDMDAHIYGDYHSRFTTRHPVNQAWAAAPNSLGWLLSMSWDEFNQFNRAALPEYLDLLAEDLDSPKYARGVLMDGGVCHPALLAQVMPPAQIVCLSAPALSSEHIWQADGERGEMKTFIHQLPQPEEMWRKFLAFDALITATILQESRASGIPICARGAVETAETFALRVRQALGIP
ncbi:MAG: hypothetical protein HXY39_18055 [Chloroflexi bacterium]|nr:hypothetical protein [Chloroflexota bacterium]